MNELTALIDSPVGILKLDQTGDAISAVHFMDEKDIATNTTFPTIQLQDCATQLVEYFQGSRTVFGFAIAQQGTVFQERVWQQLQTVDYGKTISYNQLAIKLGDPKCIRAAGTANGRNNLAIVVPCHRVIGSDRSLTGYAGGLWRKQWLLEHEAKFAHGVRTLF
ncbi:MAG: methylated-DNA--[protein]-cysteine S-methyltransferase [Bacteroidota bacterium]